MTGREADGTPGVGADGVTGGGMAGVTGRSGLGERADAELARMFADFARERVAAGRDVPADTWLVLDRFPGVLAGSGPPAEPSAAESRPPGSRVRRCGPRRRPPFPCPTGGLMRIIDPHIAGFDDDAVDQVLWRNPARFYGQSGRLVLDEPEPAGGPDTYGGNSVVRGEPED